jgi:hypothetical protein
LLVLVLLSVVTDTLNIFLSSPLLTVDHNSNCQLLSSVVLVLVLSLSPGMNWGLGLGSGVG